MDPDRWKKCRIRIRPNYLEPPDPDPQYWFVVCQLSPGHDCSLQYSTVPPLEKLQKIINVSAIWFTLYSDINGVLYSYRNSFRAVRVQLAGRKFTG